MIDDQHDPVADRRSDWSTFFYRDSRALMLLIGMVAVAGLTSFAMMPRMEDPVLGRRGGLIATSLPGADAQRVEALVTEPLEDRLQDVEEIKKMTSESRPGISSILIELRDEVIETDEVWSEVRGKLNDAVTDLPPDAQRPEFDELDVRAYAMIVSIVWEQGESPNWSMLRRYAKQLEDDLQALPATEVVDRFADPGEEITVVIDPEEAAALGLNAADVADQMAGADSKQSAGMLRTTNGQFVMEMANQFERSDEIADTIIRAGADGRTVRVGDIATIRRGVPDPMPRFAKIDGRPAVTLGVMVRKSQRIDRWRIGVQQVLDDFALQLPAGLATDISLDQNRYVNDRLSSLAGNLVLGIFAVVLVIWFLMGWRSAIVVALSLPLSGFTVLFGLRLIGIPMHQMSITGMIIAIGLLIDNAIVAVDEVTAEMQSGRTPLSALQTVVGHLALPLSGSTVTTALAFAPIAMMPGPAGEFVGSISISVILAVFASLFFSLTVIPVIAAKFLDRITQRSAGSSVLVNLLRHGFTSRRLTQRYRSVLKQVIDKPVLGISISLVLPAIGFAMFTQMPEQFFPAADRDQFYVTVELPVDASIVATATATDQVNEILLRAGATKTSWFYGESAPVFYYNLLNSRRGVSNFAGAIVQMESADGILDKLRDLQSQVDVAVPQARVLMRQLEQGPPFVAPVEVRLFGPDLDRLRELGDQVRVAMAKIPRVTHTRSLLGESLPTVSLDVDEAGAKFAGLRPADVSRQLFGQLEGVRAGHILEDTEQIPVVVRVGAKNRSELGNIRSLELTSAGSSIPLASIASVTLESQIAVIHRLNRRRMNEVAAYITAGSLPSETLADYQANLAATDFELPQGYTLEYGGEASQRDQAVGNLMANVGLLFVAMIATLVLSFRSFRLAAVILVVASLSTGLGMIGLYCGGYPFGFMAIIGTMGLIGVAINDSIVVLAALRQRQRELEHTPAEFDVDQVVHVTVRCTRHVIATTLTTIAGFTPLIIAGGKFWPPLAIAIAGGVAGATLLALCLVPTVFTMMRCRGCETTTSRDRVSAERSTGKQQQQVVAST